MPDQQSSPTYLANGLEGGDGVWVSAVDADVTHPRSAHAREGGAAIGGGAAKGGVVKAYPCPIAMRRRGQVRAANRYTGTQSDSFV